DFFAMSFLNADAPPDAPVATGSYVTGRTRGVRVYPYSINFDTNPLTFGDIQFNSEVHAQGTVWCNILWEMRQAFIAHYGQQAGREAAERLVINGLKTLPLAPTMIDGRDAILLADATTNNNANRDLIWRVFARRGMGRSASVSTSTGVGFRIKAVEGYDVPAELSAGEIVVNEKPPQVAVLFENFQIVVVDRDLAAEGSVVVTVKNSTTGEGAPFLFQSTSPGRFASPLVVVTAGTGGRPIPTITAQVGDEIVISYANARNGAGAAETVEMRMTVGRRVTMYEYNFEQGEGGWMLTSAWHMTERRFASSSHSIYFAKRKGENEKKSFTQAGSTGPAYSPAVDLNGLTRAQLEFDYYFNGAMTGTTTSPSGDVLVLGARNFPYATVGSTINGEPPLSLTYDLRPQNDGVFRNVLVDLRFIGKQRAYFNFNFAASQADVAGKKLEGFYLDNVRVTAVSTQ
ncbi:MAG TPA: M36 family metallopeptidase, partial [Blastocatellia bacterium]|nr:M36 family metallopeptidase [Blastocatellia bacterium]